MPEYPETPAPISASLDPARAVRLRLALEAEGEQLLTLLQDPDPDLIGALLKNPNLTEEHLLALLRRRTLPERLIARIQRRAGESRRLKVALAAHPNTPAAVLSALLPELFLFELVTVIELPATPADQKLAAERAILKRLPETELGNKITLARRGTPGILEALLRDGEPQLVETVLANPRLKEAAILSFLRSPSATAETISAVGRHPRWGSRPNVRYAMLRNRKTPFVWFTLFLPTLRSCDLEALSGSQGLTPDQRRELGHEIARRKR